MRHRASFCLAATLMGYGTGIAASHPAAPSMPPELGKPSETTEAPVNERDRLALIFIGYTSAKLCADAGHGFSAPEVQRIAGEVTRASDDSGFTQPEQDALWIDVLTSMSASKEAPTAENCAEDRSMLRFQMPKAFAPKPDEQSGL